MAENTVERKPINCETSLSDFKGGRFNVNGCPTSTQPVKKEVTVIRGHWEFLGFPSGYSVLVDTYHNVWGMIPSVDCVEALKILILALKISLIVINCLSRECCIDFSVVTNESYPFALC